MQSCLRPTAGHHSLVRLHELEFLELTTVTLFVKKNVLAISLHSRLLPEDWLGSSRRARWPSRRSEAGAHRTEQQTHQQQQQHFVTLVDMLAVIGKDCVWEFALFVASRTPNQKSLIAMRGLADHVVRNGRRLPTSAPKSWGSEVLGRLRA